MEIEFFNTFTLRDSRPDFDILSLSDGIISNIRKQSFNVSCVVDDGLGYEFLHVFRESVELAFLGCLSGCDDYVIGRSSSCFKIESYRDGIAYHYDIYIPDNYGWDLIFNNLCFSDECKNHVVSLTDVI